MNGTKKHLVIGTAICAATILLFLVFNNQLPDLVPVQISIGGSVGNALPKPLVVFGMPVVFAVVNIVRGLLLVQRENTPAYQYYIIPGIAVLYSIVTILWALNM